MLVAEQELDRAVLVRLEPGGRPEHVAELAYSEGVSVSSTAHCSNSCRWMSFTRARILKHGASSSALHVRDRRRELVDHQLHPQLGGLVLDDEQHLVVVRRARLLRREQHGRGRR